MHLLRFHHFQPTLKILRKKFLKNQILQFGMLIRFENGLGQNEAGLGKESGSADVIWMQVRQDDIRNIFWRNSFLLKQTIYTLLFWHINRRSQTIKPVFKIGLQNSWRIASVVENIAFLTMLQEENTSWKNHFFLGNSLKHLLQVTAAASRLKILNFLDNVGHILQSLH